MNLRKINNLGGIQHPLLWSNGVKSSNLRKSDKFLTWSLQQKFKETICYTAYFMMFLFCLLCASVYGGGGRLKEKPKQNTMYWINYFPGFYLHVTMQGAGHRDDVFVCIFIKYYTYSYKVSILQVESETSRIERQH